MSAHDTYIFCKNCKMLLEIHHTFPTKESWSKKEEVETLLLDVNELEFLLGQLSKTNFVGSDVQTVFQTMYKLQERYKLLSPNKNNS